MSTRPKPPRGWRDSLRHIRRSRTFKRVRNLGNHLDQLPMYRVPVKGAHR